MKAHTLTIPNIPEKARILSVRQERAIAALVQGKTVGQAAAFAHVDPKTLFKWRADPSFASVLRSARDDAFRATLDDLRRSAAAAVSTSAALLKAGNRPEVRLGAARMLLTLALRANETVLIEERLARVEAAISIPGGN